MSACDTSIRCESCESVRARGSGKCNTTRNQYQCAIIVQELQMSPFTDVWRSWLRRQNERQMRRRGDERRNRETHPRSGRGRHASFYQRRDEGERGSSVVSRAFGSPGGVCDVNRTAPGANVCWVTAGRRQTRLV